MSTRCAPRGRTKRRQGPSSGSGRIREQNARPPRPRTAVARGRDGLRDAGHRSPAERDAAGASRVRLAAGPWGTRRPRSRTCRAGRPRTRYGRRSPHVRRHRPGRRAANGPSARTRTGARGNRDARDGGRPEIHPCRVEIHDGGAAKDATVTRSRENGSVAFAIDGLDGARVESVPLGSDDTSGLQGRRPGGGGGVRGHRPAAASSECCHCCGRSWICRGSGCRCRTSGVRR